MIAIGLYYRLPGSMRCMCQGRRSLLFFRDFLYNGIVILRFRVLNVTTGRQLHMKSKNTYYTCRFLSFVMRLGNVIIITTPDVHKGCNRRNVPDFGRVFLMLNYTEKHQNTYIQSSMVTEILAREKCGLLWCLRTVYCPWCHTRRYLLDHKGMDPAALLCYRWMQFSDLGKERMF